MGGPVAHLVLGIFPFGLVCATSSNPSTSLLVRLASASVCVCVRVCVGGGSQGVRTIWEIEPLAGVSLGGLGGVWGVFWGGRSRGLCRSIQGGFTRIDLQAAYLSHLIMVLLLFPTPCRLS